MLFLYDSSLAEFVTANLPHAELVIVTSVSKFVTFVTSLPDVTILFSICRLALPLLAMLPKSLLGSINKACALIRKRFPYVLVIHFSNFSPHFQGKRHHAILFNHHAITFQKPMTSLSLFLSSLPACHRWQRQRWYEQGWLGCKTWMGVLWSQQDFDCVRSYMPIK